MNQNYTINVNTAKTAIEMQIAGTFTPADVDQFVSEYNQKVNSVNAAQYTLQLDCTGMNVVTPEMVPFLEDCYKMYKQSGFNKVEFQIKGNTILKMQLKRIARNTGLTNAEIVELG